jgi:hypothetical protein
MNIRASDQGLLENFQGCWTVFESHETKKYCLGFSGISEPIMTLLARSNKLTEKKLSSVHSGTLVHLKVLWGFGVLDSLLFIRTIEDRDLKTRCFCCI